MRIPFTLSAVEDCPYCNGAGVVRYEFRGTLFGALCKCVLPHRVAKKPEVKADEQSSG